MKTNELINVLSADAGAVPPPSLARQWRLALAAGAIGGAAVFALILRPRADLLAVLPEPRVLVKFVIGVTLAFTAGRVAYGLARPGRPVALALLCAAPAIVLLACAAELLATPSASWGARMIGHDAPYCVTLVPTISLAPLAGFLYALSRGAPVRARLAGFVAGVASGGIGATIYALHCNDDSPLFVAVWYTIAVLLMGALGAFLAPRVARW